MVDAPGRHQGIAGAFEIPVPIAVDQHRGALYQGGMRRIAFEKTELPAVQVLGQLYAGYAVELHRLGAKSGQSSRFRCAYRPVDDFRRTGIVEAQKQAKIIETVLRECRPGDAFGVDDVGLLISPGLRKRR